MWCRVSGLGPSEARSGAAVGVSQRAPKSKGAGLHDSSLRVVRV